MIDLIENLKVIALQAQESDRLIIEAAINRIKELESKLNDYEEDITDWKFSVETQMGHENNDKWAALLQLTRKSCYPLARCCRQTYLVPTTVQQSFSLN